MNDKTAMDVATWMSEELNLRKEIYQDDVVARIETKFGKAFVYENELSNAAISKDVLKAFNKLTGENVVWSRSERYWRFRQKSDGPGRIQE